MFPWGRRGSASQAAGGDGLLHLQQDHDMTYINNKYDEDDILGAMKEIHYNNNHSRRLSNNISSFHPTNASRYNTSNSHSNSNGQAGNEHGQSRSNRSSQRYSHLQNSNSNYGHYGHQQHDSVQSMQQFYRLHEYRRSEDHNSIRYYSAGEYHLDLTATSGEGYQGQQQGIYGYMQSPRTPDQHRERKVVVNRTSMDDLMDESEGQYSPPPPSRSTCGAASTSLTTTTAMPGTGTGASPTQQQQRTVSNCDNNSPAKLTHQARHHTYSGSLASSTTSSILSSSSSSSSSSTVVSTTTSPVQLSPSSSPSPSSKTPQTPKTPQAPRSRMSSPAATPFLSLPPPSTPRSSGGRYNTTTVINTRAALGVSTESLDSPTTSTATTSPTATVATSNTLSSPSSSTSSPSTLNNRHSFHSLPGGGSTSSSSSSMLTMKTKAFEGDVNFNKKASSPPSPSSPLSIFNSPPRPLSLQQYRQEYQVSRPIMAHLNDSLTGARGGGGGTRRSLSITIDNAYPMGDMDRQGNLMMPAMAATNGADTGDGKARARTGTGVSTGAGAGGGGADGGYGGGEDRTMEFGGTLGAEDDGDDEDTEPCYVFSVPHWETIKAGLLPTSKPARDALIATIILALITIALEAVLLHRHKVMTVSLTSSALTSTASSGGGMSYEISFFRPLTVYYSIFILAEVFAVGLLWDAAIHKNSLQLVAFTLFEWCIVSYSGLQIWQHDQLIKDIGITAEVLKGLDDKMTQMILFSQLGVQFAGCLGITLLTWRLYSEFGWLVFQKLGADVSLRKMMKEYRLLFTLLKLDAFFFLGYAIQVAALTDMHWQKGLAEIAFAIPLSSIILLLGFCALRNENKVTMGGFISCLGLLIAYMIYRLVALYQTLTGDASTDPYFFSRKTMTVFATLTLFVTVLVLVYAVVMLYNFNKGLKEAMQQYRVRRSGTIRSVTPSTHRTSVNGGYGVPATGLQQSQHGLGGDVGVIGAGGKRLSNHHQSNRMSGVVGLGSGGGSGSINGGGNGGGGRGSKRVSRRSLLYCEPVAVVPAMVERWSIE
ncbi:hypothetical protein EC957_011634 [Mortierella hygrophila]|uniref:Uncharacterized protein n=1 Tax=Mortierella hygrophila TaxID=979708 RepID=A0A9P6K3N5_9FUNG|nr:hypothetical protein EC957_011634 [Mortierella hygrophila]